MQYRDDHQTPWTRPLQPSGVARPRLPVGENGLSYTPNEPDGSEAFYAAKAEEARRRAAGLRVDPMAEAAGAKPFAAEMPPRHADAVLYSSSTGIHPQSEPENAFADEDAPCRGLDAAKPSQPTPLPRRRRHQNTAEAPEATAVEPVPEVREETLRERANKAKERVAAFSDSNGVRRRAAALAAAESGEQPAHPEGEAGAQQILSSFAPKEARLEEPFSDQSDTGTTLLVNTSNVPFGLHSGLEWNLGSRSGVKDEESMGKDQMDNGRMPSPMPAPIGETAASKPKKGTGFLAALVVVMLLAAAIGFLWLSGMGGRLLDGANRLFSQMAQKTIQTGEMSVVPEEAAVPTALVVTLSTDSSIADLRLLNEQGQVFDADVICNSTGEDCLWICRLVMDEPYTGFIRVQLLTRNGDWVLGSSSRYVNIN